MAELKNQPCYTKDGEFLGWFSRSVAAMVIVVAMDSNKKWHVLGSERGSGAADYQGFWNMPCGYVDFNETVKQAACRECFEETGVKLDPDKMTLFGYNDKPTENRQNITFRFMATIPNKTIDQLTFSKENNEKDEVGEIAWIPFDSYKEKKWAFGHDKIIAEVIKMLS